MRDAAPLKPTAVRPGDRLAVVAPASPFPRGAFEAGVGELRRLGFAPEFDAGVFDRRRYVAGEAAARARALMAAWLDPGIPAILAARGGYGSVELLPFLSADAMRRLPKLFVGYSDLTALLAFLTTRCGIVALHGPCVAAGLDSGPAGYDASTFVRALTRAEPLGPLDAPALEALSAGDAVGSLYGGNLTQLAASMGTPYAFDPPSGCVLFLEDAGERPYRIDRMLTQLALAGVLDRARAVVFGQLPGCDEPDGSVTARAVAADALRHFPGPVLWGLPAGHTVGPALTLPLGVRARVVSGPSPVVEILESAVAGISESRIPNPESRNRSHPVTRVHLIGICGTAMATLAAMLKRKGLAVRGSDEHVYPPMSTFLEQEGIPILNGYDAAHITTNLDLVIVGNAISRGNPELEEVLDRKIRYCSLPEAVREHFLWGARSIVVAGTHGKTTTTALAGWLLVHAGLDPSVLVGGIAANLGEHGASYRMGRGREFVIEGDEYDSAFFDKTAKFLKYLPDIAVIANIEFDHADIYDDLGAVRLAFRRLANLVPRTGLLLLGADSPDAAALAAVARSPVETFGVAAGADWFAYDLDSSAEGTSFRAQHRGTALGVFRIAMPGEHNVKNALAAMAIAAAVGVDADTMREGLAAFAGVKRRLETVGSARGVTVLDDFAHHPTAVRETLAAVRASHPGARIWAVFEPRSASSCRRVFQDAFTASFAAADEIVIAQVYRAQLPEDERLSPVRLVEDLVAAGRHARFVPDVGGIIEVLAREVRDGDIVVVMSNGGFGGIHAKLLAALAT